jgi:Spy/CpxP family protein refolding chaperone
MTSIFRIALPVIGLLLVGGVNFNIQAQEPPSDAPESREAPDLLGRLRLTPDQLQRIRGIQRDLKDERAAVGLRLRESNRALEDALDAESVDEQVIEQRIQAVNAAQNAQLRLRIQTEMRIRQVLNAEQLATLKEIRLRAADLIRARQDRPGMRPGTNGLRPQRNGMVPLRRSDSLPPSKP